jgi:hypothetical protein
LIALTNAVALVGAYYNRSGEPESTLRLSERELQPPYIWGGKHENSGLALKLRWRVLYEDPNNAVSNFWGRNQGESPKWLDREKMKSLGFDVDLADSALDDRGAFGRELGRDVLLVLEFDGPAYQQSLVNAIEAAALLEKKGGAEDMKRAAQFLDREKNRSSRIFVIDAGLDHAALRAKYADRSKYAIVRGQVRPAWRSSRVAKTHSGYVSALNIEMVNVPLEFRDAFEGASPENDYAPTTSVAKVRYEATVVFGERLEPRMTAASRK